MADAQLEADLADYEEIEAEKMEGVGGYSDDESSARQPLADETNSLTVGHRAGNARKDRAAEEEARSRSSSSDSDDGIRGHGHPVEEDEDEDDEDKDECDLTKDEQDEVVQPYFRDFATKVGWNVTEDGSFEPVEGFSDDRSIHVLHSNIGSSLKSTFLKGLAKACNETEGYGALYLSETSNLNNILHQVVKKWGKDDDEERCPDRPYIIADVPRAFSDKMGEKSFWGSLESLLTAITDGKYEGGELEWPGDNPVIVVGCQVRPIIECESKPICHVSADRLMGNVFTMELGERGYELVPDVFCDSLAIKVRQAEEAEHEAELAQCKNTEVLTPFDLFKKFVISGEPGKFVMDASAPRKKWVAYTTLHLAFRPYAPKIGLKGPGCLSKLIAEWYKDELADGRLVCKKLRRAGDREGDKVIHMSFTQVPRS